MGLDEQAEAERLAAIRAQARGGVDDWLDDVPAAGDPDALRSEVTRLNALDAASFELARKQAARSFGVRPEFFDRERRKAQAKDGPTDDGGSEEIVETLEAWPDAVDGASLAEEIRDRLRTHVVFANSTDADALTVWLFGSYCMDVWRLWPKVLIESPTKRCGKTTLLEVLEAFACRGLMVSNLTAAVLFRVIDKACPTLMIDEADRFLRDKEELNGIINAGHTRRSARVPRCIGDNHDVKMFSVWGPQIFAGIGKQADTLADRSVIVRLRRKLEGERAAPIPFDLFDRMVRARRQLFRWADDNKVRLGASEAVPPPCGNDRRRDNFTPLWQVAAALGGAWPKRIEAAYGSGAVADDDDEPMSVALLSDMMELFAEHGDRLQSADVVAWLTEMEDRPWCEWRHGRPATARSVAKLLKPFGIVPRNMKLGSGSVARGYFKTDVEAAFQRYGSLSATPLPRCSESENPNIDPLPEAAGSGCKTGISQQYQDGSGVADKTPQSGGEWGLDGDPSHPLNRARFGDDDRDPENWR